jgi:formylglycine-generating enzyme required for sulfatase activity
MVVIEGSDAFLQGPTPQEKAILKEARIHTLEQQKIVRMEKFAVSETEVTLGQFEDFVSAADYRLAVGDGCSGAPSIEFPYINFGPRPEVDLWNPEFEQTERSPVVCVSLTDAMAYAQWLSRRTGFHYRLPSEAEWELLARATYAAIGDAATESDGSNICRYENIDDSVSWWLFSYQRFDCDDGYGDRTAPTGAYTNNRLGVYDVIGNVAEYVGDCGEDLEQPPERVRQNSLENRCTHYVTKGVAFLAGYPATIPSGRAVSVEDFRAISFGFRVVRELSP